MQSKQFDYPLISIFTKNKTWFTLGRSGAGGNGAEGSPSTSSSAVQGEEAAGGSSSTSTADSSPSGRIIERPF